MASTTRSPTRSSEDIMDSTPLLGSSAVSPDERNSGRRFVQRQSLRQAARFLCQSSTRRLMREHSLLVRETAAEQLEGRQSDWAYSKPVVILDIIWNFTFVVVAAMVLVLSRLESPNMPLRLWIVGYALQCIMHMACVCIEYKRRQRCQLHQHRRSNATEEGVLSAGNLSPGTRGNSQYVSLTELEEESISSIPKYLEYANTTFSFIWWIVGFYWVSAGGQSLAHSSPQLYWLCIVFLGFDVFFVGFCVALACVIGIAVCCCLPCIIALLYAVADQVGASKEDIKLLSKFKFKNMDSNDKLDGHEQNPSGGVMTDCGVNSSIEHVLSQEDAECCICLSAYENEVELRQLPCGHHFHCSCVDKWLVMNATCPLCKCNILKSSCHGDNEV